MYHFTILLFWTRAVFGQASSYIVKTLAGSTSGTTDGIGTAAKFGSLSDIAVDADGVIYVADYSNHLIRKVSPTGEVTTLCGSVGGLTDGFGTLAQIKNPSRLIVSKNNSVIYFTEALNHDVRMVTRSGLVSTLAAGLGNAGSDDGTGNAAKFNTPYGVAFNSLGDFYIADSLNHKIRKVTLSGVVTTFAGSGVAGFNNAVGVSAQFNTPMGIYIDAMDNIYVADTNNHKIRKITNDGTVSTFAGSSSGSADGTGVMAQFNSPYDIDADSLGNLYVADYGNHRIRKITTAGVVTTIAGTTQGFTDAFGSSAQLSSPMGIAINANDTIYVADTGNTKLRTITLNCDVGTFFEDGYCQQCPMGTYLDIIGGVSSDACLKCPSGTYSTTVGATSINTCLPCGSGMISTLGATKCENVTVINFAGTGVGGYQDGSGSTAMLNAPGGMAIDPNNNIYLAEDTNCKIRKILPDGTVSTLAGSGAGFADGTGTAAMFKYFWGLVVDPSNGNIFVADRMNHRIRKVTSAGVVTTLAGSTQGYLDGTGTAARFNFPCSITIDSLGNLYVNDEGAPRIRKVTQAGVVTTIAGSGAGGMTDATGTAAQFNAPRGITVDPSGNLYISDWNNNRIRKITPAGVVTTHSGTGTGGSANGFNAIAEYANPTGIFMDSMGRLLIADTNSHKIRSISSNGFVNTLAGTGSAGFADGLGTNAQFSFGNPSGVLVDSNGVIFTSEYSGNRVRKLFINCTAGQYYYQSACYDCPFGTYSTSSGGVGISSCTLCPSGTFSTITGASSSSSCTTCPLGSYSPPGSSACNIVTVSTLAGSGTAGFADGTGSSASFNLNFGVDVDSQGNIYVAEHVNHRIRKITASGVVTTFAGGVQGFLDSSTTSARFDSPTGLAVDGLGNIYVADNHNCRIRKITALGVVTTVAGGTCGYLDATGTNAQFNHPWDVAVDSFGIVYVADTDNRRIRKIDQSGVVTTIAGSGAAGFLDGVGTSAIIEYPTGIAVDKSGNLYVADAGKLRIRKISPSNVVSTIAGNGVSGIVDGFAATSQLKNPMGVNVDNDGNVYVADSTLVRIIYPNGYLYTIAGKSTAGSVDGDPSVATFAGLTSLGVDAVGRIYAANADNNNVRKIQITCAAGSYYAKGICQPCPSGTWSSNKDFMGSDTCIKCPIGTYSSAIGATSATTCQSCPAGTFSSSLGLKSVDSCKKCPAFTYSSTVGATALSTCIDCPQGYISAPASSKCWEVTISTFAGSGTAGYQDGLGSAAQFNTPYYSVVDKNGTVFVADMNNHRIRRIWKNGQVSTYAGTGTAGSVDGSSTAAQFSLPDGVSIDENGNIYVADQDNNKFRVISNTGVVSTLAGSTYGFADGTGTAAKFTYPWGISSPYYGSIYGIDRFNHRIRKIKLNGDVTTYAGSSSWGSSDGPALSATFKYPSDIAFDSVGNLYVADRQSYKIRMISKNKDVTTVAGSGATGSADGIGVAATFNAPSGISFDHFGMLFIAEDSNSRIRVLYPNGRVRTLFGGSAGGTDGLASVASVTSPNHITKDDNGVFYITDNGNHKIRKMFINCPAGEYYYRSACYSCPLGTYQLNVGVIGIESCIPYPTGSYSLILDDNSVGKITIEFDAKDTVDQLYSTVDRSNNILNIRRWFGGWTASYNRNNTLVYNQTNAGGFLVSKFNEFGDHSWTSYNYGNGWTSPTFIETDLNNNILIAGYSMAPTTTFCDKNGLNCRTRIKNSETYTGWAAKYSSAGDLLFVLGVGSGSSSGTMDVASIDSDSLGNILMGGSFSNSILAVYDSMGVTQATLPLSPGTNGYVVKYNSLGNFTWVARINSTGVSSISRLALDSFNNVYALGTTHSNGVTTPIDISDATGTRVAGMIITGISTFVVKYSSTGSHLWNIKIDGSSTGGGVNLGSSIRVDKNGDIVISGFFAAGGTVQFFNTAGSVEATLTGLGSYDGFLVKYTSSGAFVWATQVKGTGEDQITSLSIDSINNIVIGGTFASTSITFTNTTGASVGSLLNGGTKNSFVAEYSSSGNFLWSSRIGGSSNDLLSTVDVDSKDVIVASGTFTSSTLNFFNQWALQQGQLNKTGNQGGFIVKYNGTGSMNFNKICLPGTYSNSTFVNSFSECTNCPSGTYTDTPGSFTCKKCPAGSYATVGSSSCTACSAGTIAAAGSYECAAISVQTIAGSTQGYTDRFGTGAQFNYPFSIAADQKGNVYVGDFSNYRIRKVTPSGEVTTFAGSSSGFLDGPALTARFGEVWGVAVDGFGNVFVADSSNNRIRKINPSGVVSTFAGSGVAGSADAWGTSATFNHPMGIAADRYGNVYVADSNNHIIRMITPTGSVTRIAGTAGSGGDVLGSALTTARFSNPRGIAVDSKGVVYISDSGNHKIKRLFNGTVTLVAGSTAGFKDDVGAAAQFNLGWGGLAIDKDGVLYQADRTNHRIRMIYPSGQVTTLAGTSTGSSDGDAFTSKFALPLGVTVDSNGIVYVADSDNHRVKRITSVSASVNTMSVTTGDFTYTIASDIEENWSPVVYTKRNWECPPHASTDSIGNYVPVRLNADGDTECLSVDSSNCMWRSSVALCNSLIAAIPTSIDPLTCGADFKRIHSITGYETTPHFCSVANMHFKAINISPNITLTGCDMDSAYLNCPNGVIRSAFMKFGRWDNTVCPHATVTGSTAPQFKIYSMPFAVGQRSYTIPVGTAYGLDINIKEDPYSGIFKHWRIDYTCG